MKFHLFKPRVHFQIVDPLGDGLADAIHDERQESGAISLEADDRGDIQRFWEKVEQDLHRGGAVDFAADE